MADLHQVCIQRIYDELRVLNKDILFAAQRLTQVEPGVGRRLFGLNVQDVDALAGCSERTIRDLADTTSSLVRFDLSAPRVELPSVPTSAVAAVRDLRDYFTQVVALAHRCAVVSMPCAQVAFHLARSDAMVLAVMTGTQAYQAGTRAACSLVLHHIGSIAGLATATASLSESDRRASRLNRVFIAAKLASVAVPGCAHQRTV